MSNFDEKMIDRIKKLEREVERLRVKESPGAWLDWTPTQTGWTDVPAGIYRYCKVGNLVTCKVTMSAGTSNDTVATLSLPFANYAQVAAGANGYAIDNGIILTVASRWYIASWATSVKFFSDMGLGDWTASGTKRIYATFTYEAA